MRKLFLCLFLWGTTSLAFADTAFEAVRVLKNERGPDVANAICEIHGERGGPAPENWVLLLNDPKSRSGLREIVISRKKIISDRTPMGEYGGVGTMPVLDVGRLTLDSDGVFRIANKQAIDSGVGFHWIGYKLTRGTKGAVWRVYLTDYMGAPVGKMYISAENGSIVRPLELDHGNRSSTKSQSEWVQGGGLVGHADQTAKNVGDATKQTVDKTVKFTEDVATKTKKKFLSVSGDVQEWLTGKRTIDPNKENGSPNKEDGD